MDLGGFCSGRERYLTLGAHGSPLGKDTLSAGRWGTGRGITSSLSRGNVSVSMELSLSSLSSSSSRESSGLYGSFSLKASRLSCLINACDGAGRRRSLEATCGTQVDGLTACSQPGPPCVHVVRVFAAARWGQTRRPEEKQPSCCEWLECCPPGEGGDPAPRADGPLCFEAAQSRQV